ncbi:uncharacterized protein LOC126824910 isoform X6 [Patella vulgata]|uniref:uncharacterized protein LOC126824910 isoform X6 n=1 Tax=Patella vulgata TaxID=6465 RepID=UPI0024A8ACA6|nr:uncharacterized protein LOC126824910 isoform X6 [Patella vulgata]
MHVADDDVDIENDNDDEVELTTGESDNKEITLEDSKNQPEVFEISSSKPSSLPHYARNTDTQEVFETSSIKPSSLPHYARNTDTPQNKVAKYKQDNENVSYSEFDVDLKIEPISNIKKMFEYEGSLVYPVPSPERKIKNVNTRSKNFNSDDLKNQCDNEMEIISGATPVEDVTLPSVSVRNMLKMWEENKTTEDRGHVDKPFNRLSKKWHSCGHIYFKAGNESDSLTDGSVRDYVDVVATQPGRYESDSNRQRENKRVLYKSSSYISLTPSTNNSTPASNDNIASSNSYENFDISDSVTKDTKTQVQDGGRTITTTTTKTVTESKGDPKGGSSSMKVKQETSTITSPKTTSVQQNGVDSRVTTQTTREEVRQTEISKNMANMAAPAAGFDDDDEDDEGVYENVPSAPRTDVFRETDAKVDVELPQSGRASNMRERFLKLAGESAAGARTADRELTPPPTVKGKVEAGVFESQPSPKRTDVYRQETRQEVVLPEKGKALNTVQKYKEIASKEFKGPANKREITPDRSGVVEYVSEPRAEHMTYEEKPLEAGIFESKPTVIENVSRYEDYVPDARPQSGTAKSIASKYKEIERNAALPQAAANRREITPDKSGPNEFVSEPRGQHITYEEKVEAGIYENEPAPVRQDIYRHEEYYVEEPLPEKGYAKNLAARFREIEQKAAIPRTSGHRVSPPKDDNRNVYENEPTASPVTYKEAVVQPDVVPEKGLAKNLASRYKKIEEENLKARSGNRQVKEFTPPKDERTVFESAPTPSRLQYEEIVPESGILESQPTVRDDVYRYTDAKDIEVELPERGAAKNLLSKWKQIESESAKGSPPTPGRVKEFTPPREEERIKQLRSPKTPPSGQNNSVHPNDLPGQYHPINEPTVFESKPTPQREDLYREADTDWTVGLPKANKTKKVLAKFQAIQAQTTSSSPVSRKAHDDMDIPTPVRENKA